jgi:outer membrane protein assembly factor BamA
MTVNGQNIYLDLKGKDSTETSILNAKIQQLSFPNFQSLNASLDSLEQDLLKSGYIDFARGNILKVSDSSYLASYSLNILYDNIKINGVEMLQSFGITRRELEYISISTENNEITIPFPSVETVLNYLNLRLSEMGDPFVTVELQNIKPSKSYNNTLEATLIIYSEEMRRVNNIKIRGYEKFPKAFLKYTIGLREGMVFQKEKINSQSRLLNNLGFVKNTKSPEVLFTYESTDLYLYLEKVPNNLFDGILGFTTNEETNKLELNGYINLLLGNNLNFGEQLQIQYQNDGNLQERFQVETELPYILQTPFGIELGLTLFKQDSTFLTVEKNALANYRFNTRTKIFGGYKDYESSNLQDELQAGGFVQDYTSRFFVFGGSFSIPQNSILFPNKSTVILKNELGKRKTGQLDANQYRLNFKANHIFNLNTINSIYFKNSSGYLSSENYLANELYRFGGINSIRGFDENSIDASFYSVLNTEYRFLLNLNTYLHSITDLAYFENPITESKSQIYSFGLGLGLLTKAGKFKFEIANGTFEGQNFKFYNTKIHLSLQAKF